jgi:hypothetical protein
LSPAEVWEAATAKLAERLSRSTIELWIGAVKPVGISEGRLVCEVPSRRFAYTQKRYGKLLALAVREVSELDGVVLRKAGLHKPSYERIAERDR